MTFVYFKDKAETEEDAKIVEQCVNAISTMQMSPSSNPASAKPATMNMGGNPNMIQISTGETSPSTPGANQVVRNNIGKIFLSDSDQNSTMKNSGRWLMAFSANLTKNYLTLASMTAMAAVSYLTFLPSRRRLRLT